VKEISPQVLIVGAGPTGLMMACQLAIQNIPFRIVEKNAGITTQTRAIGVQARSLEIFRQMGFADKAVEEGQPTKAVNYLNKNTHLRIPIGEIGKGLSEFPYLLMLEQSKTEKFLLDFLHSYKVDVEWDTELISFSQNEDGVRSTVKTKNNKEETLITDYIVGADGAHSAVRHQLSIPLAGATYKQSLYVLDCQVDGPFKDDEVYLSFGHETFVAFFPMKHNLWRIVSALPPEVTNDKEVTFEDIHKHFSETTDVKVTLSHPKWLSAYHSHHRCVSHFREGRAFLAGDSAHIHSPVGAQGMNTGLQDAYNLGWKLALVLQKKAKPVLLDTYNVERLPNAKRLVETTDRVFSMVVAKNIFEIIFTRYIIPMFVTIGTHFSGTRKLLFQTVSQIGIHYPDSLLATNAAYGSFNDSAAKPGDRLPYVGDIQNLIDGKQFVVLLFTDKNNTLQADLEAFVKEYKELMKITVVNPSENIASAFDMQDGGFYLVRPDMYIAYRSKGFDKKHLGKYLEQFLIS